MAPKRWHITSDKFLDSEQVIRLTEYLLAQRDLAIARQDNPQAIRDYYLIRTALETGLRVFELCNLINNDFHGQKLEVRHGKGDKARSVLLTKTTSNMLKEWTGVKLQLQLSTDPTAPLFPSRYKTPYTTRGIQKRVKQIFKALEFPAHLSVHSLRHTYCSLLMASGKVSLATVRDNLGHHSVSVTNLYSHAIGDLSEVELYNSPSSQKTELSELEPACEKKKPSGFVKAYLRKVNFK